MRLKLCENMRSANKYALPEHLLLVIWLEKRAAHSPANKTAQGASRECPCFSCAPLCLRMCVCVCVFRKCCANYAGNARRTRRLRSVTSTAGCCSLSRPVVFILSASCRTPCLVCHPSPLQSMLSKMLPACRMLLGNQIKLVGKT